MTSVLSTYHVMYYNDELWTLHFPRIDSTQLNAADILPHLQIIRGHKPPASQQLKSKFTASCRYIATYNHSPEIYIQ
jgi:hypothetical protein